MSQSIGFVFPDFNDGCPVGQSWYQVKLIHPAGLEAFDGYCAVDDTSARAQALAAHPGYSVEWTHVQHRSKGVFAGSDPTGTRSV